MRDSSLTAQNDKFDLTEAVLRTWDGGNFVVGLEFV